MLTRDDLQVLAELESSMRAADPRRLARPGPSRAPLRSRLGELCAPLACTMFVTGIGVIIAEIF
jgi:hypothetical protein